MRDDASVGMSLYGYRRLSRRSQSTSADPPTTDMRATISAFSSFTSEFSQV